MELYLDEIITDPYTLYQGSIYREGFGFTGQRKANVYDAIVVRSPADAEITGRFPKSQKSLEEHVKFINENKLKSAVIIAKDLSFITRCPTLENISVFPADGVENLDFSPFYERGGIVWLYAMTSDWIETKTVGELDYSRVKVSESVRIKVNKGTKNLDKFVCPKQLALSGFLGSLSALRLENTREVELVSCRIKTLDGIENAAELESFFAAYCRSLCDVSALSQCPNLKEFSIDRCAKVKDISAIPEAAIKR